MSFSIVFDEKFGGWCYDGQQHLGLSSPDNQSTNNILNDACIFYRMTRLRLKLTS